MCANVTFNFCFKIFVISFAVFCCCFLIQTVFALSSFSSGGGKDLATVATLTKKYKTEAAAGTSTVAGTGFGMAATGISSKSDAKQQQQQPGQKVQPAPPVLNKLAGGNFIIKQPSKDSIAGVMMASG